MTITPETTAQATIVPLLGQINSANAGALEAQLLTLVDGGVRQLVLDFAALDYISSAGLRLVLCAMQPHVHEVFDISGFLAILDVQATRQEALARL